MKRVHILVIVVISLTIVSCTITTEEILKKYETYGKVDGVANKVGITIEVEDANSMLKVTIGCSNPKLCKSKENMEMLADRFFIASASAPNKTLSVSGREIISSCEGNNLTSSYYCSIITKKSRKTRFLLIGFKGIDKSESEEFETPPLFFIFSIDDKNTQADLPAKIEVLTKKPLLAGNLFNSQHTLVNFVLNIGILEKDNTAYAVQLGEIDKDEDGNIIASFYSDKIEGLDPNRRYLRMNGAIVGVEEPVTAQAIIGDRTIESLGYNKEAGKITYLFGTKEIPDKFVIRSRNRQTAGDKIYFDSKTKNAINIYLSMDSVYGSTLIDVFKYVRLGEISKDKDGYTSVEFIAEELNSYVYADSYVGTVLPFRSYIIVNGKKAQIEKYYAENGYMKYIYNTKEIPTQIIVWRGGYEVVFDGITKKVIK